MSPMDAPSPNYIWNGIVTSAVSYCRGRPSTDSYKVASIRVDPKTGLYTVNCIDANGRVRTFHHAENSGAFYRLDHARKPGAPMFGEDSGNLGIGTTIERVIADGRNVCETQVLGSIDVTLKVGIFVAECIDSRQKQLSRSFRVVSMSYYRINDPRHSTLSTVHTDPLRGVVATSICRQSDKRWIAAETIRHGNYYEITCEVIQRPKNLPPFVYFLTRKVRYVQ